MEPLDPFKNEGSSGPFKRRISSILKAPRKSIMLPDPEQQENVVECAKPIDKRNSRRVSFAPANDVLLFSKDAKNVSPARSPLQELMTATAADSKNSVQFAVTENGIQQITGMETLLKAPLHASQRDMVNADAGVDLGEKTVLFSTEDASMDMTYCHTLNIASDADILEDIPLHNYHILPTGGEKMVMFPADGGSMDKTINMPSGSASLPSSRNMDLKSEKKNTASSVLPLDSMVFENFLASLSQPSCSSVNPAVPRTSLLAGASSGVTTNSLSQRKTQRADIDKENQAPSFVPDVFEKTVNASLALFPEDDVSMDMTEAQTGRIQGFNDTDDNPFQFLFPSQEMYSQNDNESLTAERNKHQQSRTLPSSSSKDMTSLQKALLPASLPQHLIKADTEDECRDKTIRFTAGDDFMDMTQSQTVKIASDSFPPLKKTSDVLLTGKEVDKAPSQRRKTESSSTHGGDLEFKNFLAGLSEINGPGGNPANTKRIPPVAVTPRSFGEVFKGDAIRPEMDVNMDMTEARTSVPGSNVPFQFLSPTKQMYPKGDSVKRAEIMSGQKNRQDQGSSKCAGQETLLKSSLKTKGPKNQVTFESEDDLRERTVRFSADDACMDERRSRTVNIVSAFQSDQNLDCFPAFGEKTVRFTANDAAMDETRSLTVNFAVSVEPKSHQRMSILPPGGEETLRFSADDAAMDATKSQTGNTAISFEPQLHQPADVLPTCGEKTLRFFENDATMNVTQCLTVNIENNSEPVLSHQESKMLSTPDKDFSLSEKRIEMEPGHLRKTRSFTAHSLDIGLRKSLPRKSGPFPYSCITKASFQEAAHSLGFQDQLSQRNDVETETPAFVLSEKVVNKTMTEDVTMEVTEAQTGQIRQTDEYAQGLTTQDINPSPDHLEKKEVTSQNHEAPESSMSTGDKVTNRPESLDSNESDTWKESEPRLQTLSSQTESSPVAVNHDEDAAPSRKSRRMSLADLHSKIRRLSQMINTAPEVAAMDGFTAHNGDKNPKDRTQTLPVTEPEPETSLTNPDENTQAQNQIQEEQSFSPITTTPYNLKTRQLMSRLSVSTFKAKLPQRPKPEDQKRVNSVGEHTRTMPLNVTTTLNNFDADVSDINDEELGSLEDATETIDTRIPQKTSRPLSPSGKIHMEEPSEDDVFEQDFMSTVCGRKRPLMEEENSMEEDEKRMKGSTEVDLVFLSPAEEESAAECEGNFLTAPIKSTQNTDYSNISHTGSRCEATSESTFKHSLFESQLEEYASDVQAKFDDGTITVSEFFKLFSIDFVIHTPRQSVNPGRLMSDSDCTPMDLLKDRHIVRPKQMVYESDVRNLTEKVEELKGRMQDLEKPLRIVNRALWEEMQTLSEKELTSFGAKLKERNNFFRKTSKVQSHEMKEVLYSQIVQADLEEQQKLRGRIKEADEMMKSLDECIHELETELASVEEKGSEDRPSLKSCQEELQKVTEALADTERQTSELEMQKTQSLNKITRLKSETRNLESHISVLNMITEWRFGEKTDDCTVYTFLHKTFHLQLDYHKSSECDAEKQSERKISDIKFTLELDGEKSEDHACLVHKLLSQYVDGETSWVKRYPTSRHVPKLLHDVSLVVSRCRLLGEEVRLLKMWGSVRLNILSISCVDTRVLIVFSSLKAFSKFEVIFSISLNNQLCVLQVQDFRNLIGSTTIEQIEEIVASFSPGKNQLTKIIKKINEKLLC